MKQNKLVWFIIAAMAAATFIGCGGGSTPTQVDQPTQVQAPAPLAPLTPVIISAPSGAPTETSRYYTGVINADLSATITNHTNKTQPTIYCAYELPSQTLIASSPIKAALAGGDASFDPLKLRKPRCGTSVDYQLDLGALDACPAGGGFSRDVLAAFKFVRVSGDKCEPTPDPTPKPTPSPLPSPSPCPVEGDVRNPPCPSPTPPPTPPPTPVPTPTPTPTPTPSPTPTPPPVCSYSGNLQSPQFFDLADSGDATELGWVLANVGNYSGPFKTNLTLPTWVATGNYPVVLIKGPQHHYVALFNVVAGTTYGPYFFNQAGQPQAFSHSSIFLCGGAN